MFFLTLSLSLCLLSLSLSSLSPPLGFITLVIRISDGAYPTTLATMCFRFSCFRKAFPKMTASLHSPSMKDHKTHHGKGCNRSGVVHGFSLVKGKSRHSMEDYHVAEFRQVKKRELGLFAIYDGHMGDLVSQYLQQNLFDNILKQPDFWNDPVKAVKDAYLRTDKMIIRKAEQLGWGGSTAVTAILIDAQALVVANIGDSRAVMSQQGTAIQLSVDHEPSTERGSIENMGGFVSNFPGDVPRVDGQLAVSRAFGDKSLKVHLRSDPDIRVEPIDIRTEFLILASDGLWKVMGNQEAVNMIREIEDPEIAAKRLTDEALARNSKDDISCIVVRLRT